MKIEERSGFIHILTTWLSPLFICLMPEVPKNHPALEVMVMNMSANALALDNAETPLSIKAMQELQKLNPLKDIASNAHTLFLGHL